MNDLKEVGVLVFLCFLFPLSSRSQPPKIDRPNIIFFLVDDMGWQDTSVPFWDSVTEANRKFYTPNMEILAERSVKFTSAYANSICTPSRVSLLSGMNAAHHRVTNWTSLKDQSVDGEDSLLRAPDWNVNGLSPLPDVPHSVYVTPLPEILKDNGYYTIQCGKAHFGAYQTPGADPLKLGFVKNIGGSAAGSPESYLAEIDFGFDPDTFLIRADIPHMEKYWGTRTFLTEDLTKEAMLAMDTAQMLQQPFFLYMSHYAVHLPYNPDGRFVEKYLSRGYSKAEAAYCALVEGMDQSLGEILHYLNENGLMDNTIIVFMSDNGGYSHPPRQGEDNTQNYPLRGGKGSLYEGGIREPMLVFWPGVTQPGAVSRQYFNIEDFYPTILEMAEIDQYKTVQRIDGKSIVPYIEDPHLIDSSKVLIWHYPNAWVSDDRLGTDNSWLSAVRQGKWKLIYSQKHRKLELYDLDQDIKEQHNLASMYPQRTNQLARLLTEKLQSVNAQMPYEKSSNLPVPWPDEQK